jgi:hypothetical protein
LTNAQRNAAAALSLFVVAASAVFLLATATMALAGALRGDTAWGHTYLTIVFGTEDLKLVLAPLGAIITGGLALFAASSRKKGQLYLVAAVLAAGIAASLVLLFAGLDLERAAKIVRDWPRDVVPEAFASATKSFAIWTVAAFAGGLVALLGLARTTGSGQ